MNNYIYVIMYFMGLAVFGFLYWLLNGILDILRPLNIADTTNFASTNELVFYIWSGIVVVYLLFGGIWMIRLFNQDIYSGVIR